MAAAGRKVVLITGGNSGIGFEAARQLLRSRCSVVLACRSQERAAAAAKRLQEGASTQQGEGGPNGLVDTVQLDLEDLASVRRCAEEVTSRFDRLDVLLCNAGIYPAAFRRTGDGHESTFQANHLGHFLLVHVLLPLLSRAPAGRVVVVSSELHKYVNKYPADPELMLNFKDTDRFLPGQAYALSKLYNVWFTRHLAGLLPPHVVANAVTPGFVPSTNMSSSTGVVLGALSRWIGPWMPFAVPLAQGGARVVNVCVGEAQGGVTGQYFKNVMDAGSADSQDLQRAARLWAVSCKAAGIEDYLQGVSTQPSDLAADAAPTTP